MNLSTALLLTGFLLPLRAQDPTALIEQFRSERAAERDEAFRKLLEIGESARISLEKAKNDPDREVADRVRGVLRRLDLRNLLTPALLKAMPDADHRLGSGEDRTWTEVLFEAAAQDKSRRRYPDLRSEDLKVLASRAWRGAKPEEWDRLCTLSAAWQLPSALPGLLKLTGHEDPELRRRAFESIRILGTPPPQSALIDALKTETDEFVLSEVLQLVQRHEVKAALPELRRLLLKKEFRRSLNRELLNMLPDLATDAEIPSLIALWKQDWMIFDLNNFGDALTRLNAGMAADLLQVEVTQPKEEARHLPLQLFLRVRSVRTLAEARKLVGSTDNRIRGAAHDLIRRMNAGEAVADLKPLLKHSDRWVQRDAAVTLAALGDPSGMTVLMRELEDQQLRTNTLSALGMLDCRPEFPALIERVKGGDYQTAFLLIGQGGEAEIARILPLLQKAPPPYRSAVGHWLALAGSREALTILNQDLQNGESMVQFQAAEHLGKLGIRETLDLFREAARSTAGSSHYPAIRYLGRIGGRDAIPLLDPLLDDAEPGRRREALIALEEAFAIELLPRARALLTDADPEVRLQAATWLVRSGSADGVPALLGSGRNLFALNALRRPDLWKKLSGIPLPPSLCYRGELRETNAIAAAVGMKWDGGGKPFESWWGRGQGPQLLYQALEPGGAVLEADRIRDLSRHDAFRFWADWWKGAAAKTK